jgi:hypothetical protein
VDLKLIIEDLAYANKNFYPDFTSFDLNNIPGGKISICWVVLISNAR